MAATTFTDPTTGLPVVAEDGKVVLRDAQGYVAVPADMAGQYIAQQGFIPATAEEVEQRKAAREQEGFVGGTKAAAKAFAAHAFDAATFPVAIAKVGAAAAGQDEWVKDLDELSGHKVMENLAGIVTELSGQGNAEAGSREFKEATQAQFQAHEGLSTAAGIAGDVVGGFGLAGGTTKLGSGLASGLSGKLGTKGAELVGKAAGMGLEGGVFGVTQASEQSYINDDPITSQKILAGFGLGAALGAGAGAGMAGASFAGRAARDKADDLVQAFGKSQKAPVELADQSLDEVAKRALGPDVQPAPGLGHKLREALEDAQSAVTGADREALRKYGPLRWDDEAMKGREMAFRRDEILEGAKGEMTEKLGSVAKNAESVMQEVRDMGLKREHIERLLKEGAPELAGKQKSTALQQLWGVQDELATIAAQGDQFGNAQLVRNMQKMVGQLAKKVEAGDAAEAFIGLDEIKRALQKDRVSLGNSAMKQGSAFRAQQAQALGQAYEQMQERVRQSLMDETVWGKAGMAQREVNAAWENWFEHNHMFQSNFLTATKKKFGGGWEHAVNPQKVSTYLERLGRKESALVDKHFRGYLEATERLTKAIGDNFDVGSKAAQVQEVAGASRAVAETLRRADKTVAVANQVQDILQANADGGLATTLLGGIAGGPLGAAAGALVGAVTNPGRQLKMAWGLQNMMGKVDHAIKSNLDGFFAVAKRKVAKAADKAAKVTDATTTNVRRAMLPAGVAFERFSTAGESRRLSYEKRREQIATLISNPARLTQLIEKQVEPVMMLSPSLGSQMALDMARALRAVQDAAPQERGGSPIFNRDKRFVDDRDITRFAEAWEGVTSPLTLLEDLRKGRMSLVKRDAVAAAYPDLFRGMQLATLERLQEHKEPLPLQQRTLLDQFLQLGGVGEPTLRPDFLRRQAERAQMRAQQAQQSAPPQGAAPNIAGGAATLTQSLAT